MQNSYAPSKQDFSLWENGTFPWLRTNGICENDRILTDSLRYIIREVREAIRGKSVCKRFYCFTLKEEYISQIGIKFIYYYFLIIDRWCKAHITTSSLSLR